MSQVDPTTIRYLCVKYGPLLLLPPGIDGAALMWAIAGRESTFGRDTTPRHEPAYDVGGIYALNPSQAALLTRYGRAAACSYGPWQVMLVNCGNMTPSDLDDPEKAARACVFHTNGYVLCTQNAATVEQIAQTYNSGNFSRPATGEVLAYIAAVRKYYDAFEMANRKGTR